MIPIWICVASGLIVGIFISAWYDFIEQQVFGIDLQLFIIKHLCVTFTALVAFTTMYLWVIKEVR